MSSMSGIAGNARPDELRDLEGGRDRHGRGARARARRARRSRSTRSRPGFIETQMTAAMPLALREAGRRMNRLRQGGLPVDVAETIAWLATRPRPASTATSCACAARACWGPDGHARARRRPPRCRCSRGPSPRCPGRRAAVVAGGGGSVPTSARRRRRGRPRPPRRVRARSAASTCATSSRRPTRTCSRSRCTWR